MKKRNAVLNWSLRVGVLSLALMLPLQAMANSYDVFVGYADNLRATGFFPNPWSGAASVDLFAAGGASFDAGAVMIHNSGAAAFTINDLVVTINPSAGPVPFQLWGASLSAVIDAGQNAIFSQTGSFNFDTSDFPIVPQDITNNCSVGALSTTALCTSNAPLVAVTVNGVLANFHDTGHVLITGGFDANCCLPNGNESLQWRLIGTTGVENPGGSVPEPASVLLLACGLVALAVWLRKQQRLNKNA
jgi:hypothetical protein